MQPQSAKSRAETIEYVQSMLGQLRTMAHAEQCDVLAYLIEMAYLEAGEALRGGRQSAVAQHQRNAAS